MTAKKREEVDHLMANETGKRGLFVALTPDFTAGEGAISALLCQHGLNYRGERCGRAANEFAERVAVVEQGTLSGTGV